MVYSAPTTFRRFVAWGMCFPCAARQSYDVGTGALTDQTNVVHRAYPLPEECGAKEPGTI